LPFRRCGEDDNHVSGDALQEHEHLADNVLAQRVRLIDKVSATALTPTANAHIPFEVAELRDGQAGRVHFFNAEFVRHFGRNQAGNCGFARARLTAYPVSPPGKPALRERLNAAYDLVLAHDIGPRLGSILLCKRAAE